MKKKKIETLRGCRKVSKCKRKQCWEKNISIENLAELINDNVENIIKYEENELEPTLDKKLSLCNSGL